MSKINFGYGEKGGKAKASELRKLIYEQLKREIVENKEERNENKIE